MNRFKLQSCARWKRYVLTGAALLVLMSAPRPASAWDGWSPTDLVNPLIQKLEELVAKLAQPALSAVNRYQETYSRFTHWGPFSIGNRYMSYFDQIKARLTDPTLNVKLSISGGIPHDTTVAFSGFPTPATVPTPTPFPGTTPTPWPSAPPWVIPTPYPSWSPSATPIPTPSPTSSAVVASTVIYNCGDYGATIPGGRDGNISQSSGFMSPVTNYAVPSGAQFSGVYLAAPYLNFYKSAWTIVATAPAVWSLPGFSPYGYYSCRWHCWDPADSTNTSVGGSVQLGNGSGSAVTMSANVDGFTHSTICYGYADDQGRLILTLTKLAGYSKLVCNAIEITGPLPDPAAMGQSVSASMVRSPGGVFPETFSRRYPTPRPESAGLSQLGFPAYPFALPAGSRGALRVRSHSHVAKYRGRVFAAGVDRFGRARVMDTSGDSGGLSGDSSGLGITLDATPYDSATGQGNIFGTIRVWVRGIEVMCVYAAALFYMWKVLTPKLTI